MHPVCKSSPASPIGDSLRLIVGAQRLIACGALCVYSVAYGGAGFYAGLDSGVAVVDSGSGEPLAVPGTRSLLHESERLTASTVYGGYRFAGGFALEAARTSFGTGVATEEEAMTRFSSATELMSTWSIAGIGAVELTRSLSLFGKLGMSFSPDTTGGRIAIESSARPGRVYGFGVSYQATARLELRAQSERYTGLWQTSSGELEANALTFGARMGF